jgi:predicted amidophosphoribosyltransferase
MSSAASKTTHFRFILCPACSHQFEWLGSRLPNYCPECARPILQDLRCRADLIIVSDPAAHISFTVDVRDPLPNLPPR